MSIDSQETEDDNDSGKGPGAENLSPPLSPTLGNDQNPSPPSSPKLSDIVPPDERNESDYDWENLKHLHDEIKLNESSFAQDPDKHAIELKNLKSKYDNALKAKKNSDKKKKIGKKMHPIHSVADHHEDKPEPFQLSFSSSIS